jgi:hypothetical protein
MPESPLQDYRTSHHSRHGEHRKSLRKRWPMVKLCSKHKNHSSKGQIGRGMHPKRRKTITHGTNSGILRALFCAPGGIYRPEFLKLNLTMPARHYPSQWSMYGSLCPYESVTPKPCSWRSQAVTATTRPPAAKQRGPTEAARAPRLKTFVDYFIFYSIK